MDLDSKSRVQILTAALPNLLPGCHRSDRSGLAHALPWFLFHIPQVALNLRTDSLNTNTQKIDRQEAKAQCDTDTSSKGLSVLTAFRGEVKETSQIVGLNFLLKHLYIFWCFY